VLVDSIHVFQDVLSCAFLGILIQFLVEPDEKPDQDLDVALLGLGTIKPEALRFLDITINGVAN